MDFATTILILHHEHTRSWVAVWRSRPELAIVSIRFIGIDYGIWQSRWLHLWFNRSLLCIVTDFQANLTTVTSNCTDNRWTVVCHWSFAIGPLPRRWLLRCLGWSVIGACFVPFPPAFWNISSISASSSGSDVRQLGQTALQTWATRQEIKQSEAYIAANPSSHRGGKKNSIGVADLTFPVKYLLQGASPEKGRVTLTNRAKGLGYQ